MVRAQSCTTATSVTENYTPVRVTGTACSADVSVLSDGVSDNPGYCPYTSVAADYEISFNFSVPSGEFMSAITIWANAGGLYNDGELRVFDMEVDYTDPLTGLPATLIMDGVDIGDTANANDPKSVDFLDNGSLVLLSNVTQIRLDNLQGVSPEVAFRELAGTCSKPYDFDDSPASYGGVAHTIDAGYRLGISNTSDASSSSSNDDTGDDGVTLSGLTEGITSYIDVDVTGSGGYLQGWIDWNGDGDFDDAGEQIITDLQDNASGDLDSASGSMRIAVLTPISATGSSTYARFRWSSGAGLGSTGFATDGEVEDYSVSIASNPAPSPFCIGGDLTNVGFNSSASQSTTRNESNGGNVASVAVDGNTDGNFFGNSVTHTAESGEVATWWQTDLGSLEDIDHVNVWNRTDCCGDRLDDFYLFVSSSPFPNTGNNANDLITILNSSSVFKYQLNGAAGTTTVVPVSETGRYVRIQLPIPNFGVLSLAEVEVNDCKLAKLSASLSSSVWDPNALDLHAIPGSDVIYTHSGANIGDGPADADSILLVIRVPAELEFYNGDIDDTTGPEVNPVSFTTSPGSGLTFTYATDVRYSNSGSPPVDFLNCTYDPLTGYDPAVTYICINPKGSLQDGTPSPNFTASFRARIK